MSIKYTRYAKGLNKKNLRSSLRHKNRHNLHKMDINELKKDYEKYYSEQANIELSYIVDRDFEKADCNDYFNYEKWLSESEKLD